MIKRLTAIVYGRVQGVNFRYYTQREAKRLGLTGWVANRHDGTVKAVAEGPEAVLNQFVEFLYRGSPSSYVDKVDPIWSEVKNEFADFQVRWL